MSSNWNSTWYPAPHALRGVLAGIWAVRAGNDSGLSARVLPDGTSSLVFRTDGSELRTSDGAWTPWETTSISGPRSGPFEFELSAGGRILIAQLRPEGGTKALGVPMSTISDRFERLDAVVGRESDRLTDLVSGAGSERSGVRAVESWLLENSRIWPQKAGPVEAAVELVTRHAGNVRVDELARSTSLSRRHLVRLMRQRVGASPKLFARITRFHHAVQLSRVHPERSWVEIALDAGYADQPHLNRDFAEFGGIRPRDLRGPRGASIW